MTMAMAADDRRLAPTADALALRAVRPPSAARRHRPATVPRGPGARVRGGAGPASRRPTPGVVAATTRQLSPAAQGGVTQHCDGDGSGTATPRPRPRRDPRSSAWPDRVAAPPAPLPTGADHLLSSATPPPRSPRRTRGKRRRSRIGGMPPSLRGSGERKKERDGARPRRKSEREGRGEDACADTDSRQGRGRVGAAARRRSSAERERERARARTGPLVLHLQVVEPPAKDAAAARRHVSPACDTGRSGRRRGGRARPGTAHLP
ncbi:atherin-like [Schistocerca cancellata]|uniref:atherin-like n=1 Tax=Schistocerca cancellata TaxID=274614 RepID=UPI0021199F79|nr:atherin-like [Schistocerca cancellata]